jgi:hypothetical protein
MSIKVPPKKFPAILIGKQKYGDLYYIANSLEGLHKAALELVKFRKENEGCYQFGADAPDTFEEFFKERSDGQTVEEFEKMKEALGEQADKVAFKSSNMPVSEHLHIMKRRYEDLLMCKKVHDSANRAIAEGNGKLALGVLYQNADNQYEGIEIEYDVEAFE